MKNELVRKIGLDFSVGVGFIVTQLFAFGILGQWISIELQGSIKDLGIGAGTANFPLIGIALFSLALTGLLMYIWAKARRILAKGFGLEAKEVKLEMKHKFGVFLTLVVVGIITAIVFLGFSEFISGISPSTNIASLGSLWNAISQVNPLLLIAVFIAITVFGALVALVGSIISPVQSRIPKFLDH